MGSLTRACKGGFRFSISFKPKIALWLCGIFMKIGGEEKPIGQKNIVEQIKFMAKVYIQGDLN
jgi:hypothetical protein